MWYIGNQKMDKATEYLILQEAEWSHIIDNLKSMALNAQKVFLKPNINTLKTLAKKLKTRDLKDVEREAIRRIPGFKKDFSEAQEKTSKLKFANKSTSRGLALATALVSSTTGKSVNEVIKKGEMGVRNAKILPTPGLFQLLAFGLFVTFIISIFLTDGGVIMPAIKVALQAIGMLVVMLGQIIKAIIRIAQILAPNKAGAAADTADTLGSFWDATQTPSSIPGDIGIINPDAAMAWIIKALGF